MPEHPRSDIRLNGPYGLLSPYEPGVDETGKKILFRHSPPADVEFPNRLDVRTWRIYYIPSSAGRRFVNRLEEGTDLTIDWSKLTSVVQKCPDVVPCAVQNADTREVILVAYVNDRALQRTRETGRAVFWSTSRNELWEKGLTSGETFDIIEIRVNCEQNSLLYIVRPRRGNICHTKNRYGEPRNCYYRKLDPKSDTLENTDP
jgi:phosphoribosyl-AMP cyclohydrolase